MPSLDTSLDTNIILRLLLGDNQKQLEHIVLLLRKHERFVVADQAVIEVVYSLGGYYDLSRKKICEALETLLDNQQLEMNRVVFRRTLRHYAAHPALSFTDCYLEACAHGEYNAPLYTLDKKLARQLPHAELVQ